MFSLKIFSCFVLLQFFVVSTIAQVEVVVPAQHFYLDASQQLILVNENLVALNTTYPGSKTSILVEENHYTFENPVLNLEKGLAYAVLTNHQHTNLKYHCR